MARQAQPALDAVAAQVAERASRQVVRNEAKPIDPDRLLSSGATLLNLACTARIEGAFEMGDIITVPGASSAGKTLLLLHTLAEAANNPLFDKHDLIFDDVESALRFDIPYLFGSKLTARFSPPAYWSGSQEPRNSKTIEEVKGQLLTRCGKKKPFVYVCDSLDALTCDAELERAFAQAAEMVKEDPDKRKDLAGSYNTEKARLIHELFRVIKDEVAYNNSIVFFTQQLKQNFGAVGPFSPKFRTTGGEGPFFFSSVQIWMNKKETYKAQGLKIGSKVGADVRKNKLNGRLRDVDFPVYYDMGIDDIGSMVDFMVDCGVWKKSGQDVVADCLDLRGTRPKTTGAIGTLVEQIEEKRLIRQLRRAVGKAWNDREESVKLNRPCRYE